MTPARRDRIWPWVSVPAVVVILYLGIRWVTADPTAPEVPLIGEEGATEVGAVAAAAWRGEPQPDILREVRLHAPSDGVYAELRAGGVLRGSAWDDEKHTLAEGIGAAVKAARKDAGDRASEVNTVLLCTAHGWAPAEIEARDKVYGNVHRGVRGIEFALEAEARRYTPLEMLARNLGYEQTLEQFLEKHAANVAKGALPDDLKVRTFSCEQFLVPLANPKKSSLLVRGNHLIEMKDVDGPKVERAARLMGEWLLNNLTPEGRMVYKWWPSRGEESSANNQIRQWMASVALGRFVRARGDAAMAVRAAGNIRYNLSQFYREENGLGLIVEGEKVKLGAVALAGLALVESPQRAEFAAQEKALTAMTFHLQEADGAFNTMYAPPSPDRPFQNFYTGEALLFWATLYQESKDPALLERYMRSFRYYRDWHRRQRNPAFVPWHTQANYLVWKQTRDKELAEFIFEMNDWLLGMQEWEAARYPDLRGRFYDADRKHFGPPHASSTGVYLEGLSDALALARELGEKEREVSYRNALVRGLRSVLQLQFGDEADLFYVSQRERVLGGVRTELYDNTIRVDNVQHNLMALMKLTTLLTPADYESAEKFE